MITTNGTHLKAFIIINREICEAELFPVGDIPDNVLYAPQENAFTRVEIFTW
jgi:hypothetical protein